MRCFLLTTVDMTGYQGEIHDIYMFFKVGILGQRCNNYKQKFLLHKIGDALSFLLMSSLLKSGHGYVSYRAFISYM